MLVKLLNDFFESFSPVINENRPRLIIIITAKKLFLYMFACIIVAVQVFIVSKAVLLNSDNRMETTKF